MPNIKTSDETAASVLDGTELVRIVQIGNNRRTTTQDIANLGLDIFSPNKPAGTIGSARLKDFTLAAGTTVDLLSTVTASGYISEITLFSDKYATEVIVTVDGEGTPSIDCNLADLLGEAYLDTQPAFAGRWIIGTNNGSGQAGGSFRLPIPFSSSVRVQVKNNEASSSSITGYVVYHTGVPNTWPYTQRLHAAVVNTGSIAAYTETNMVNVSPGVPWRLAAICWLYDGFPGSLLPRNAALEGPFKIYVDDNVTPKITTSGGEDLFGMGWYFNHFTSFGTTSSSIISLGNPDNYLTVLNSNTWGAHRFFINDPIVGDTSLKVTWTPGDAASTNPITSGTATLRSTVFYYTEN